MLRVRGTVIAAMVCTSWRWAAWAALESWHQLRWLRSIRTKCGGIVGCLPTSSGGLLAYGCGARFALSRICDKTIVQKLNGQSASSRVGNRPPPPDPTNITRVELSNGIIVGHMLKRRPPPRTALGDIECLGGILYADWGIYVADDRGRAGAALRGPLGP